MKLSLIKSWLLIGLLISTVACKDDLEYGPLVRDNRPAIPVTFTNATSFGGTPFIEISTVANTPITYTLSIPASSGRTIREITAVVGGGTGINAGSINTVANRINTAPIPGSGTTATFTTTLAAFRAKYPTVAVAPTGLPYSPREIAFIFLVTLDDGTQLVTTQVRTRVLA
jgi:hypothetical protein